jgi:hypothetical protein
MAVARKQTASMSPLIMKGLIIGYLYSIVLSASAVTVCEVRGRADCSSVWSQAYAVATGLVTTFMAYFVQPESKPSTRREEDAGQP